MKSVAVLITVYNRKDITVKCLQNLYGQNVPDDCALSIYLTDDGCTDGTPQLVSKLFPEVKILHGDGTLFWNRGMLMAWESAVNDFDYDFYLWLNDDTYLYPDSVSLLLSESRKFGDRNIIVGSTCAIGNKNVITYGGWVKNKLITDLSDNRLCDTINGNIVLIPRYSYQLLGMNDYRIRHCGDTDYGLRAKEKGLPCATAIGVLGECNRHDKPTVWKDPSKPFGERWKNFFSPLGDNPFELFYFSKKHYGLLKACLIFVSNWVHFFLPWLWINSYKKP